MIYNYSKKNPKSSPNESNSEIGKSVIKIYLQARKVSKNNKDKMEFLICLTINIK